MCWSQLKPEGYGLFWRAESPWLPLGRVPTMLPMPRTPPVEQRGQIGHAGDPSELNSRNFTAGGRASQRGVVPSWLAPLRLHEPRSYF